MTRRLKFEPWILPPCRTLNGRYVVVIATDDENVWIVSNYAFGLLLDRMRQICTREDDLSVLTRAAALNGLLLDMLPTAQSVRLSRLIVEASAALIPDLERGIVPGIENASFAEHLPELMDMMNRWSEQHTDDSVDARGAGEDEDQ